MASKHKQEDPWAGFVDVLSNILMVVIFLVVILGISIFAISQQITKNAVEQALEKERSETTKEREKEKQAQEAQVAQTPQAPQQEAQAPQPSQEPQTPERAAVTQPPQQTASSTSDEGTAGDRAVDHALRARESDDIKGNTSLTLRSVKTDQDKQLEVASEEIKPSFGPIKVESSDAFLTLSFSKGSFRIDPGTDQAIKDYLADNPPSNQGEIEIRAFAQSTVGSVSEARRIAYYRAMQTRTQLLKNGYSAEKITIKVRESISPEDMDAVRIFHKS